MIGAGRGARRHAVGRERAWPSWPRSTGTPDDAGRRGWRPPSWSARVRFGADGLVPAVVQDAGDGRVLTQAWMNRESLERTLERGETWFWSRSRQELWRKGATSGNTQAVRVGGPGLRRRRGAGAGRPDRCRVPHRRAPPASTTRSATRPRREPFAAARRPRADDRRARRGRRPRGARTPRGCSPRASTPSARRWGRRRPRSCIAAKGARARPGRLRERRPALPPRRAVAGERA